METELTSFSLREDTKKYLAEHKIPQLFESLLSSLMMERPENPVEYIENKMCQIRDIGPENINWETLISHLHPYRDNIRRQLIRDGSIFDKEYSEILGEMEDFEQRKKDCFEFIAQERYKPEIFSLTEANS
ncbi:F-box and leucine-rich repeat protein 13-like [Physella acuta]|uniref:F-box and leucine-rich repeat protein 13-like n=1 Tax=Physella acuta TaxID=109671 RepID=UPI0027DD6D4D|nr:F-box and leucine-rich repeat protein 13-like [Physella acuta]